MTVVESIRSLGGCSAHEKRVARIASRLFDVVQPIHGLKRSDRRLLRIAALLHDAGRVYGSADEHHLRGAEIVREDSSLSLTPKQRRAVEYLVRYHCGRVPRLGQDEILKPDDRRRKLCTLLGLLRAADGLDSRRLKSPAIIVAWRGRRLRVRCIVRNKLPRARRILQRKWKFDLLEQTLGLRVKLRVTKASPEIILA